MQDLNLWREALSVPMFQKWGQRLTVGLVLMASCWAMSAPASWAVRFKFNELGYHPNAFKYVIVEDLPEGALQQPGIKIVLVTTEKKDLKPLMKERVLFNPVVKHVYSESDSAGPQTTQVLLDFSEFNKPGRYFIRLEGLSPDKKAAPVSPTFKVDEFLYWDALKPVVRTFYFQRCGQGIGDVASGLNHYACHTKDAVPQEASTREVMDVGGGWHSDSGYEKRTTSTSLATSHLLSLYEWNPKPFVHFKLDYPTTEPFFTALPDILHEAQVGLDWLMVMQRSDGAFYEKVAGQKSSGDIRPEADVQERMLFGATPTDTAAASAVLAEASRVFRKKDMGYAIKTLRYAEKGWAYLAKTSASSSSGLASVGSDTAPQGRLQQNVLTQWTRSDLSYRVWAAAELYLTTRKASYHQYFLKNWPKVSTEPDPRKNPAILGMVDYLLYAGEQGDAEGYARLEGVLRSRADELVDLSAQSAYGLPFSQFMSGSNIQLVESSNFLLSMYKITGDKRYLDAVDRSMNYLFGMNVLGKTYVTGMGEHPVSRLSYKLSVVTKKVPPGFMALGPNTAAEDGKTPKNQGARSYMDHFSAADSNATSSEGNAALAFMLGTLNNIYNLSE